MDILKRLFGLASPVTWLKVVGGIALVAMAYYFAADLKDRAMGWWYSKEIAHLEKQVESNKALIDQGRQDFLELQKSANSARSDAAKQKAMAAKLEAQVKGLFQKLKDTEDRLAKLKEAVANVPEQELPARIRDVLGRLFPPASVPGPGR